MPQDIARAKSSWIAYVLRFFLGPFGGHKFYVGKAGWGVVCLFALLLVGIPGARGQAVIKEADLVGTWHSTSSNAAAVEITYSADHHYTLTFVGIATGTMTGPWRMEDHQIVKKWTGGAVTVAGRKKQPADGSEQREKVIKLEKDTLTTQERGESRPSQWQRGSFPKE